MSDPSDFTAAANLHLAHRQAGVETEPLCGICTSVSKTFGLCPECFGPTEDPSDTAPHARGCSRA